MTTLYEVANTVREMNGDIGYGPALAGGGTVTDFAVLSEIAALHGRKIRGYVLIGKGGRTLAVIETLKPDARIVSHLTRLVERPMVARAVMRSLLGAEDYTSDLYDNIVRVHYADEWEVPGNKAAIDANFREWAREYMQTVDSGQMNLSNVRGNRADGVIVDDPYAATLRKAATDIDWRKDAYEPFSKKRYQK